MERQHNPLIKNWRGTNSPSLAASILGMKQRSYLTLESHPERSKIRSNRIIKISQITGIQLETLVDYLTQKESA